MKQRTITGVILYLVLAPLLIFDLLEIVFQIVMGGFVVIAALELIKMYGEEKKYPILIKSILVLCPLLLFGSMVYVANTGVFDYTIPLAVLILNLMFLFGLTVFGEFDGKDLIKGFFIMIYSGIGISSLVLIRAYNPDLILYLFLITSTTDTFAYLCGVCFGKHKMAPVISPKKTWEGAIGGSLFGTAVAACFALFFGLTNSNIFINSITASESTISYIVVVFLTLGCTVVSQIGDLVASKLKRTYEIKDFGNVFPGHGGVLDRFDSAIFVGMFLFAITLLV